MTSDAQIRDTLNDHLITPDNAALIIIDYQPVQVSSIHSMDQQELVRNITNVARISKLYNLPTVLSTVNVATGINKPTISQLTDVLGDIPVYDRTSINAWEDKEFREAVKATGRKKLIIAALWTEACLTFPTLDALAEGYEVYTLNDSVGGTSPEAHAVALSRLEQAGAKPMGWVQMICELQRDWNRTDTSKEFAEILFGENGVRHS